MFNKTFHNVQQRNTTSHGEFGLERDSSMIFSRLADHGQSRRAK